MADRRRPVLARMTLPGKHRRGSQRRIISMRLILSLATVTLIAISVFTFAWVAERNTRETLTSEIEKRLLLEARNLASSSVDVLLSDYPELTLCPLVKEMQEERPDLAFIIVLDHEGKIQGHTDLQALGQEFALLSQLQRMPNRQPLHEGEAILGNNDLLVASVPATHTSGRKVGTALVGLRKSYLEAIVTRPRRGLVMLAGGLVAGGIASTLILMGLLLRPIAVLRRGLERIGHGDLDTRLRLKDRTELGLLAATVDGMAQQLKIVQTEMLEKERLDHEMDLAHSMQQSLLPKGLTRHQDYVCGGAYQAATEVGGDFYDVFKLEDGRLGMVIADVSGKGLGGCLVASVLAALIRTLRETTNSPSELLVALESDLGTFLAPGTFITIFYGILDPSTNQLVYASAAHSPLLVYRAESHSVEWHKTRGIPVGAVRGGALAKTLQDYVIDLKQGDIAVQYTDGLNEAWNPNLQEDFGFARIEKVVLDSAKRGHQAVLTNLQKQAREWAEPAPLGDDLTLLIVGLAPVPSEGDIGRYRLEVSKVRRMTPYEQLEEMLTGSAHLILPADLKQLVRLHPWLASEPALSPLRPEDKLLIESSLFEVCANIIEHGYRGDSAQNIDLWWVPGPLLNPRPGQERPVRTVGGATASSQLGYFLICDQGKSYDPCNWTPPDYHDPEVRRKGRGLGLHIIHFSMQKVIYLPRTPVGNLTVLRFDPHKRSPEEEPSCV